jgi:hypothetical protein
MRRGGPARKTTDPREIHTKRRRHEGFGAKNTKNLLLFSSSCEILSLSA